MDRNRGRLPHAPPPGQGRGPAGGYLIRLQRVRRYPSRPGNRRPRRERHHRHHPLRQRREISQRKLLGPGMIRVEPEPWAAMVAHARASYPNECCGAMLGSSEEGAKTVRQAIELENAFGGAQAARYELRPEDLLAADKAARQHHMDLVGIYHSHPDCDAYFSTTSPLSETTACRPSTNSYAKAAGRCAQSRNPRLWTAIPSVAAGAARSIPAPPRPHRRG